MSDSADTAKEVADELKEEKVVTSSSEKPEVVKAESSDVADVVEVKGESVKEADDTPVVAASTTATTSSVESSDVVSKKAEEEEGDSLPSSTFTSKSTTKDYKFTDLDSKYGGRGDDDVTSSLLSSSSTLPSKDDVTSGSSIVSMTKLMSKKLSSDSDTFGPTSSTRLTSSVKIDEDDLDKEIAARMAALSSGTGYKPSASSGYSFLTDPLTSYSSYSSRSPYSSKDLFSTSTSYTTGASKVGGGGGAGGSGSRASSVSPYVSDGTSGVKALLDGRIRELETELENERGNRLKGDRQRIDLQKEVNMLKEKIEESHHNLQKQVDLNKRKEQQLQNLSRALEESQTQGESQLSAFKKKHQETVNQLMDQIDELHRGKQKSEKEKLQLQVDYDGLKVKAEDAKNAKHQLEKHAKTLEDQVKDLNGKLANLQKDLTETQADKSKFQIDSADTKRKIDELEKQLVDAGVNRQTALKDIEDLKVKLTAQEEISAKLAEDNRALVEELQTLKEEKEDDKERQSELQKRLNKAVADVNTWQQKCQNSESLVHPEEIEELKKKFIQKLQESEAKVDATIGKMVSLDKVRGQVQAANDVLKEEIEKLQGEILLHEKKHKQYEKVIDEWKKKVEDAHKEIEDVNKEARVGAEQTQKVYHQLDEAKELCERLRRENKNLNVEINDITQQLEHVTHRASDLDKIIKKNEAEKEELNNIINDKDLALQKEVAKVQRSQQEVAAARDEMERRMADKEEEFDGIRKSNNKALANLQLALDSETKNKLDAIRSKKELEQKISDLELTIDKLNKSRGDTDKIHRKYQQQLVDLQALFEDEEQMRKKAEEELLAQTQKSDGLKDEVDVLRLQVESLDRNRRMLEGELKDSAAKINELNNNCSNLLTAKKKLENSFQLTRSDNEDHQMSMKRLEDAIKKATLENIQLSEDVKKEQLRANEAEKTKRILELQNKDLHARLEATEQMTVSGGKAAWARLEQRVLDLESEVDNERQKGVEKDKQCRKQERRVQDLELQAEEHQRSHLRLSDLIDKMQVKIKSYKKQLDDAEQVSELNLAKYRKMQNDLEEAETRASVAEKVIEQLRSRAVASVANADEEISLPGLKKIVRTKVIEVDE